MTRRTNTFTTAYRRKRERRTNYRKRLKLLLAGKLRIVVRKMLNTINVQIVAYESAGDKILASAASSELKKLGWSNGTGNVPGAYLTGMLASKRCQSAGISEAVLDIGLSTSVKGSRIYSAVKGAIDAGMKISCADVMFPSEDRIRGKHIEQLWKNNKSVFKKMNPENITKNFDDVKNRILKSA